MFDKIKQWAESKGGWSHALAGVFATTMLAYAAVPQFHALVLQIHAALPGWVQDSITTGIALAAWYKTTDK